MTNIHVDQVGEMAVIECEGRFVRSDEAFRLRDAVTAQRNAHVIVLDLTEMRAIGRWRDRCAGISAALVPRSRYSIQVVQSLAVGAGEVGEHECNVRVRYCVAGRDDGAAQPSRPEVHAGVVKALR